MWKPIRGTGAVSVAVTLVAVWGVACVSESPTPNGGSSTTPSPSTGFFPAVTVACSDAAKAPGISAKAGSLVLGPVTFVGAKTLAAEPPSRLQPSGGGAFQGVFVVVTGSAPATVSLTRGSDAALWYVPKSMRGQNRTIMINDPRSVTFKPCAGSSSTWFSGGFVLRGPSCIGVKVDSATGTSSGAIGFGKTCIS